jgi:hypothetical protein
MRLRLPEFRFARTLLITVLLFGATAAHPDRAQAEPTADGVRSAARTFAEGEKAFRAGDYRHAAQSFESAYALVPHEDALWNAARAWQRAGEAVLAANLYARFLREAMPGARDRAEATDQLAQLSARLGRIDVVAPAAALVRVDDTPVPVSGTAGERSRYVNPGTHVVNTQFEGREQTQSSFVAGAQIVTVAFVDQPAKPPPPPPDKPVVVPERAEASRGWSPWVVVVGAGLTAGAGVATLISGLDTRHTRDEFMASPSEDRLADGRAKQTRTNVLLGVTAGLAALTTVTALWLIDWRSKDGKTHVGVSASPGGAMAVATGSF